MTAKTKTLQDEVLEYLAQNGLKKAFFAKKINVSPVVLSHWFAGRTSFTEQKLLEIQKLITT